MVPCNRQSTPRIVGAFVRRLLVARNRTSHGPPKPEKERRLCGPVIFRVAPEKEFFNSIGRYVPKLTSAAIDMLSCCTPTWNQIASTATAALFDSISLSVPPWLDCPSSWSSPSSSQAYRMGGGMSRRREVIANNTPISVAAKWVSQETPDLIGNTPRPGSRT
jgi:hypothetical protein